MVFTAATRLRVPLRQWWPAWQLVLNTSVMTNGIVRQSGGGLEVAGAAQSVNDMLLQSNQVCQSVIQPPAQLPHMATWLSAVSGWVLSCVPRQGYIELFPAWNRSNPAAFATLRAKGAFLVSASLDTVGHVRSPVNITSEAGQTCVVESPWSAASRAGQQVRVVRVPGGQSVPLRWLAGRWLSFATTVGSSYRLELA
jgi:hypothetical protein